MLLLSADADADTDGKAFRLNLYENVISELTRSITSWNVLNRNANPDWVDLIDSE